MKRIPEYPNYIIEMSGHVFNMKRGRYLKPFLVNNRFMTVNLRANGKTKARKVHELVLDAFVGSCPAGYKPVHTDGNLTNNRLENLNWEIIE